TCSQRPWPGWSHHTLRVHCLEPVAGAVYFRTDYKAAGALAGGGEAADEGDRPLPRRDELPEPLLGGARPVHRQRSRLGLTTLEHRQLAQMRAARMAPAPDSLTA